MTKALLHNFIVSCNVAAAFTVLLKCHNNREEELLMVCIFIVSHILTSKLVFSHTVFKFNIIQIPRKRLPPKLGRPVQMCPQPLFQPLVQPLVQPLPQLNGQPLVQPLMPLLQPQPYRHHQQLQLHVSLDIYKT